MEFTINQIAAILLGEVDGNGKEKIKTISKIQELGWPVNIIALTSFDDQELVQKAVQAGAVGFLHKDVHADKLAGAIRDAADGRR